MPTINHTPDPREMAAKEYDARLARWSARLATAVLTADQADGFGCVASCGYNQLRDRDPDRPMLPVGFGPRGQVFVCSRCDDADRDAVADEKYRQRAQADIDQARAELAQADRLAAVRAEAEQVAAEVTQRVGDAIEASEIPVLELLEGTGISVHRVAEVFDGRDCFNVSEVVVLALAAGVTDLRALFGPTDAEVTR